MPLVVSSVVTHTSEVETGFEPVYRDLQSLASPLGHSTMKIRPPVKGRWPYIRADDGVRTRDLNLGKVPRYQLRYVRIYYIFVLDQKIKARQRAKSILIQA